MWQFPKVKDLAVRKMDRLVIPPVDKAVMAREYEVDPTLGWLEQAYAALGAREDPITKAEGLRLGLDVVLQLAELRERIRKRRFEEEKNVMGSQSNGRASPIAYSIPPSPRPFMFGEPLQAPRMASPYPDQSHRTRSPSLQRIVQSRPDRPETPTLQTVPKGPSGYTEEDLEDVRYVFGL